MAKYVREFCTKIETTFYMASKFSKNHSPGSRIVPSRSPRNDEQYQLRIDAGELIDNRYRNVVLQINREAKGTALKQWLREHGSHAKPATTVFDIAAEDLDAEASRVVQELQSTALRNI